MMIRLFAAFVILASGTALMAADAPEKTETQPEKAAAQTKPTLRPEMSELRDRVRGVLTAQADQPFNTRDNSATEILSRCLAFGCDSEVSLESPQGQHINGITCLCWNYPCAGSNMLGYDRGHVAARIGYGFQEQPGEFLAMLALSRVPADYPVRVGKDTRKVSDLVEAEKLGCRAGSDKSLALIGLSYYVDQPSWKNDLGEEWSLARIVKEEIAQSMLAAPEGGLNRLLGLSFAVERRGKQNPSQNAAQPPSAVQNHSGQPGAAVPQETMELTSQGRPIDGQFARAEKYVAEYQDYALKLQNSDGSWGPRFLAARSTSNDPAAQLRTTGRVLEWLVLSLPEERLQDPGVINAVHYLTQLLGSQRYRWNTPSLDTQEIVSLGHALHALTIYDQRVFKPFDTAEKPAEEKPGPASS